MVAHPLEATTTTTHRRAKRKVEVTRTIGVEIETKGVEPTGQLPVIVEVLVKVGFPILVKIVEARDLHVIHGIDHIIDDLKAERLV